MTALAFVIDLVDRAWTTLCRPLIALLNVLFSPDRTDGSIARWRVAAWIVLNCAALALILNVLAPRLQASLVAVFLLLHILIVLGGLRVMSEEKQVLEGSLAADRMTFSVFDAVNSVPMLATSIVFYVLGLPALIGLIEQDGLARILSKRPPIPIPYLANLACVLNEMPGVGPIINAAANLSGLSPNLNAEIVYSGLAGNIARLLIVATVGFVIVRAIVLRMQQASHQAAIVRSVEDKHRQWDQVHARLLRLPHRMAERLRHIAASESDASLRQRVEATLSKLGHRLKPQS